MKKLLLFALSLIAALSFSFAFGCGGPDGGGTGVSSFTTEELEKYKIVYDFDERDLYSVAVTLQDKIYDAYGVDVPVYDDTEAQPSDYEILIGDTNRYEPSGKVMKYSVTVDGGRFKINVGGLFSAEKAIEYICKSVLSGKKLTLNSGEYYKKSLITTTEEITFGTTARIMSANILADAFNSDPNYKNAAYRAEIFAGVIAAYTPDVIGVQETDADWNDVLDKYLAKVNREYGYNYARYMATYENKINYTSMIYRADKYSISDNGIRVFTWWEDLAFNHRYHMRNVNWALFTSLTNSSKKFVFANTHWSYRTEHVGDYLYGSSTPIQANELRIQCKDETNEILTTLKNRYHMPIFLTGDFNTSLSFFTSNYNSWLNSYYSVVSEQAKAAGTCVTPVPESGHYDHIMGTGNYIVKRFDLIKNANYREQVSDHSFVYADIEM